MPVLGPASDVTEVQNIRVIELDAATLRHPDNRRVYVFFMSKKTFGRLYGESFDEYFDPWAFTNGYDAIWQAWRPSYLSHVPGFGDVPVTHHELGHISWASKKPNHDLSADELGHHDPFNDDLPSCGTFDLCTASPRPWRLFNIHNRGIDRRFAVRLVRQGRKSRVDSEYGQAAMVDIPEAVLQQEAV